MIKWVGVGYLAWLGISSLWQVRQALSGAEAPPAPSGEGMWPLVGNEFVVAISNPKALLLFAALLPQFAVSRDPRPTCGSPCSGRPTSASNSS